MSKVSEKVSTDTSVLTDIGAGIKGTALKNGKPPMQLGVMGFLAPSSAWSDYRFFQSVRHQAAVHPNAIDIMRTPPTEEIIASTKAWLHETLRQFKTLHEIKCVSFATPCLELLSPEEIREEHDLECLSLVSAIVQACRDEGIKRVGLLGTAWDMAVTMPLAQALSQSDITVLAPDDPLANDFLTYTVKYRCTGGVASYGQAYSMEEFAIHVVDTAYREDCDGVILCNTELRPLLKPLTKAFSELKILSAAKIHWKAMAKFASANKK